MSPRIAIVGGGPAGLTAGLLLHRQNIPFTVFELRRKPTDADLAKPSGMLDLHDESGIAAIKECGLLDEFLQLTGECSEAQKVADKTGEVIYTDEGELSHRPEISRHALSKLLIAHIPAERIKWGHKLFCATRTTTSGHAEIELDFGPNGKHTFDFAIGADGAWSKVRDLLTDAKPSYAGWQNMTVTMQDVTRKHPRLAELVGPGSFAALGTRHGVMSQRGPNDSARIYVFVTTPDEHFSTTAGIAGQTAVVAGERMLADDALLGTWGPTVKQLVATACAEETADNPGGVVDLRPLYRLPSGASWEHGTGATLVGDAAHLMCPWAGEGVNLAMWDSLLLAHAIVKAHSATTGKAGAAFQEVLDPLVTAFEVDMVARAGERPRRRLGTGR